MKKRPFASYDRIPDGSPGTGEPFFLAVGQLRRPHGVRGEIQMAVYTDFPERLQPGVKVYLGEAHQPVVIHTRRTHNEKLLLSFVEYPDRTAAEILRHQTVYILADKLPELPEGEFYQHQVLDLQVITDQGAVLGVVSEILETGANDVLLVVTPSGNEVLLPWIDEVVLEIDLEKGQVRVHLLPGLLPE
jgi:16S rRNA processing protein RimM